MKRRFVKVFVCMAVVAMMLSVTACGSGEVAAETTEAVAEAAATTDTTTLEDYYNDPTVKAAMEAEFANLAEDGMSASVEVKDNTMTAIIKIKDESYIVDGIGELLLEALDEEAATFEELAATFDEVIGEGGACTIVMRYVDPQDNVLAEKAFTAK